MTIIGFFQQNYFLGESSNRNTDNIQTQIDIESEEIEIINSTFLTLIGTHWYYERLIPPPIPLSQDATKEDSIEYKKELERINEKNKNPKPDTSRLVVFFKDSLIAYPESERNSRFLEPKSFIMNFSVDSSFIPLLKELYKLNEAKSIDLKNITNRGRFEIHPLDETKEVNGNFKRVGYLRYSRIAFSKNLDRACFYFDFLNSPLNGYGLIVFLEKRQGKWIIIGQREMWIA